MGLPSSSVNFRGSGRTAVGRVRLAVGSGWLAIGSGVAEVLPSAGRPREATLGSRADPLGSGWLAVGSGATALGNGCGCAGAG